MNNNVMHIEKNCFENIYDYIEKNRTQNIKKDRAILIVTSGDFPFSVATLILSIIATSSDSVVDSFIIFHSKGRLSVEDKIALQKVSSKIIFIEFDDYQITSKWCNEYTPPKSWPIIIYSRFYFPLLLKIFKKVLILDSDIIALNDISPIFEIETVAWRTAAKNLIERLHDPVEGLTPEYTTPNGGAVLFPDELENITPEYLFTLQATHKCGGAAPDEIVYGLMCFYNKIEVTTFDLHYHSFPTTKVYPHDPILMHTMGRDKFWNSNLYRCLYPEWTLYYDKWLSYGGSSNKTPAVDLLGFPEGDRRDIALYFTIMRQMTDFYNEIKFDLPDGLAPSAEFYKRRLFIHVKSLLKKFYYELEFKFPHNASVKVVFFYDDKTRLTLARQAFEKMKALAGEDYVVSEIVAKNVIILEKGVSILESPSQEFLNLINKTLLVAKATVLFR